LPVRQWHLNESGDASFDSISLEYNGFLGAHDPSSAFDWLLQNLPGADELVVRNAIDPVRYSLEAASARHHWCVRALAEAPAPYVDLNSIRLGSGEYLDRLGKNTRAAVRRSRRLYEETLGPLCLERAQSPKQALDFFAALEHLHTAQWQARGGEGAFANPSFRPFHTCLIDRAFSSGCIDLLSVTAGGEPVGYLYNFVRNGWVMAYQSGLAPAPDNRWKPGYLCHALAVQHYLEHGARTYDFLAGATRYKQQLANDVTPLSSIVAFAPRPMLKLEDGLRRLRRIAK
jgi:CelD/BcsL family acetyltransferase involved in cellulose biosynthesis